MADLRIRNTKIDCLKGLLMILVVFGHALEYGDVKINGLIHSIIYSFHMPLFICISGYLTKLNNGYCKSLVTLIETLVVCQLGIKIPLILFSDEPISTLLVPFHSFWYLLSLIFWRIMLLPFRNLQKYSILCVIVAFLVALGAGFTSIGYELSLSRTISFFPFFLIGYFLKEYKINIRLSAIAASSVLILYSIIVLGIGKDFSAITYCYSAYASSYGIIYRAAFFIIAILLSNCVYKLTPNKNKLLEAIGINSLLFYIYHDVIIVTIGKYLSYLGIEGSLLLSILFSTIVVGAIYKFSQNSIVRKLLNPISLIVIPVFKKITKTKIKCR